MTFVYILVIMEYVAACPDQFEVCLIISVLFFMIFF